MTTPDGGHATRDPAPAVTRSIRLLRVLAAASEPMTLTELASALALAKSSTTNLCLALEAGGMIARVPLGYRLGHGTAELGGAFVAQFDQIREFYTVCERSPVLVRETVQVAMLDGTDALYLARHEGARFVRIGTPLGSRLPAALSATGRALLMRHPDDDVAELLRTHTPFPDITGHGIRDLPQLLDRLHIARERGWALDEEESFAGVYGVAVPIDGWTPAEPDLAIGVAIRAAEATDDRVAQVADALQDAARTLTNPFEVRREGEHGPLTIDR